MIVHYAFPDTDYRMEWNGGHYVNVFYRDNEFDCFTFSWDKDHPSQRDAFDAIISHLLYLEDI